MLSRRPAAQAKESDPVLVAREPVLQLAVVEIRYDNGIVYLDRCGSLMLKLHTRLGKPFTASVPEMASAHLRSPVERMTVQYGPQACSVTQDWGRLSAASRVLQVAPLMWREVSEHLDVTDHVTRCGVRFVFSWSTETVADGQKRLEKTGFVRESARWVEMFGAPVTRNWTMTTESVERTLRVSMNTGSVTIANEELLPRQLDGLVPLHAVSLDLDYMWPQSGAKRLSHDGLAEFARASWQHAKSKAEEVGRTLEFHEVANG